MKKIQKIIMSAVLMIGLLIPFVNATELPSATEGAMLDSLKVKVGETELVLSPSFEKSILFYSVEVEHDTESISIEAIPESGASVAETENNVVVCDLESSATSCAITVTNDTDGAKVNVYSITVNRKQAPAPKLNGLVVKADGVNQVLSPVFYEDTYNYEVTVPFSTSKIIIETTQDSDVVVNGVNEEFEFGGHGLAINFEVKRGQQSVYYSVNITRGENPLISSLEEALKDLNTDNSEIQVYDYNDNSIMFLYVKMLNNSYIAKQYTVKITGDSTASSIVADLKETMKKDADYSMLVPNDEKVSTEDLAEIKNEGKEVLIPTDSEVIWVIDGSKLTDADKGFNLVVKVGEELEKELYDKINKLLDPKDNGLIIDFAHDGVLPKGTKVMISAEDYAIGDSLNLYYFNEKTGKLELAKSNLKVVEYTLSGESANVVFVELEHCSSYVLLPAKNNAQTGVLNVLLYTMLALGSLAGIIVLLKKKAN